MALTPAERKKANARYNQLLRRGVEQDRAKRVVQRELREARATRAASRRTPEQMTSDREKLRQHITTASGEQGSAVRVPQWARASDVSHLVNTGQFSREVREEYDKQVMKGGYQHGNFGGAGVVKRRRAYLRPVQQDED